MVRACSLLIALLMAGGWQRMASPEPRQIDHQLVGLTGLYTSGRAGSRLCILGSRFGMVIRGKAADSCSGSGQVAPEASGVHFTLEGDSACSFVVHASGRSLIFPAAIPAGCAYYCGAGATLSGVRLTQIGRGRAPAMRARDLAGEPLCGDQ